MAQGNPEDNYEISMAHQQAQPTVDPAYDPNALYADSMREDKIKNILAQINPDNLLADIEWRIRGYKKDNLSDEWVKINDKSAEINKELVANFMSFLGSVLNQNTSMSNFSAGEINLIMDHIIEFIGDDLTVNDKKYGLIGNYQEMSRIGNIVCHTMFAVLKRAQNGMEARRVFSALKIHENLTQAPQSKGLMDALKFWR